MNEERLARLRRRMLTLGGATFAVMGLISFVGWSGTEAGVAVPVHWNAAGEVDGYGSRWTALLMFPAITGLLTALFVVLPALEPRRQHLAESAKAWFATFVATLALLLLCHGLVVGSALGRAFDMARLIPTGVGLLLMVVGNYLGKVRSNFFIGIRTPWTLSSELSWRKTHRLAGRLFVALGLLMVAGGALPAPEWVWSLHLALLGTVVAGLFVYSWLVWREDPARDER